MISVAGAEPTLSGILLNAPPYDAPIGNLAVNSIFELVLVSSLSKMLEVFFQKWLGIIENFRYKVVKHIKMFARICPIYLFPSDS